MASTSEIADYYRGRSIFITGATGFMGKVLIEKFIRSCPEINQIFVMVRTKRGRDPQQRVQEMIDCTVFQTIKDSKPEDLKKIKAIAGDIMLPGLGISEEDLALLQKTVTVAFHSAATVRFDEPLKNAVEMNVKGVRRMLAVCKTLEKLELLVHVSTAYVTLHRSELNEEIYPSGYDPEKLSLILDPLDADAANQLTKSFLKDLPNTYTLTKILGEQTIAEARTSFPIAIVRPTIVTGAWKEPLPGWTDSMNGPAGLSAGYGAGIFRTAYINKDLKTDFIPVDFPTNLMIAVPWYTAKQRPGHLKVYTIGSAGLNPVYWSDLLATLRKHFAEYPYSKALWPPGGDYHDNYFTHRLHTLLFHCLPGYCIDFCIRISGGKPFLVKLHDKTDKTSECFQHYTTREWTTRCDNTLEVNDCMSLRDKKTFNFDPRTIDWEDYFQKYVLGVRKYILKDDEGNLPMARRRMNRLIFLKSALKWATFACLVRVMFWNTEASSVARQYVLPGVEGLAAKALSFLS